MDKHYKFNQGIFIDIFPLDAAPDNAGELEKIQETTTELIRKAKRHARKTTRYMPAKSMVKRPVKKIAHLILTSRIGDIIGYNSAYNQYEIECRKYNSIKTKRVSKYFYPGDWKKTQVWKREWFSGAVELPFEFIYIPVPAGYMEFLGACFGDWEIPAQTPSIHGDVVFDTSKSYSQYFEEVLGESKN